MLLTTTTLSSIPKMNRSSESNLKTFSLVWLDASLNNSRQNVETQQQLRTLANQLKTFENSDECEQYIHSLSPTDRMFLIVSDRLGKNIIPRIHELQQITSIYVYIKDKRRKKQWTKQFNKVQGVVTKLDELIDQIRTDQMNRQHSKVDESLVFTIFDTKLGSEQLTTGLNGQFLHSQLLIDCLLRMESTSADMSELISICKHEYHGDKCELSKMEKFEKSYSANQALQWYTRDTFVYRMLNKALRVLNIHLLFLFRFFIRDLGEQLHQYRCSSPLIVYRGQLMSKDELQILKQSRRKLVSINQFLSTSLDQEVALSFLGNLSHSDELERVLFEIDANPGLDARKLFAEISSCNTTHSDEQEVLFMLGSVFRVVSIKSEKSGLSIIKLKLCGDYDRSLKKIFDQMKVNNGEGKPDLVSFGNVLCQMGKLNEAEEYYLRHLNQQLLSNATCYYALGNVMDEKGKYKLSLNWFKKSLKIRVQILESDDPDIANTHNSIGEVHRKMDDYTQALESYKKALVLFRRAFGNDHLNIAMCLDNMGLAYYKQKKYLKSLSYHQKALNIRKKYLPANHLLFMNSHNNIGVVQLDLGHPDIALKHYDIALKIAEKTLPPQHPDIAITLRNKGLVYETKRRFKKALFYYRKAIILRRDVLPPTHPYVIDTKRAIRRVSSKLK